MKKAFTEEADVLYLLYKTSNIMQVKYLAPLIITFPR